MSDLVLNSESVKVVYSDIMSTMQPEQQLCLSETAVAQLETYLGLLMKWNKVMNLVGPYNWEEVLRLLLADSFYLASFLERLPLHDKTECWDLGAGAGLPGVPLRMVWQKGEYTLVEAREKRALFLHTVVSSCSLAHTHVFRGRAEAFMPNRQPADLILSRAFLPWEKVLNLVQAYVKKGSFVVFLTLQKGPEVLPEKWALYQETSYHIGNDTRYFWAVRNVGV